MSVIHRIIHNRFTKTLHYWMRLLSGKEHRFVSLKQYVDHFPDRSTIVPCGKEDTVYASDQVSFDYENPLKKGRSVDSFVVLFKQASCFALSDLIVLHNGDYYCEIKEDPWLGKSSDCSGGQVLIDDEKHFHYVDMPEEVESIPCGIFLSGLFSWNYYHFTFQIIPRLRWLSNISPTIPLLVDQMTEEIPSLGALLSICNKQSRPVIVMKKRVRYVIDELYYVSGQSFLEPNHKKGTKYPPIRCYYRPSTLDYLRQTILPIANKTDDVFPKRIFLGRKFASHRRKFNEEECIECAKEFGFEVVFPEMMSLQQQVRLFNNADFIMGGSGAAFTNLIYCKKGISVLVLSKFYPALGLWQPIIAYLEGRLVNVLETDKSNDNPAMIHAPFKIDIAQLRASLHIMLQQNG